MDTVDPKRNLQFVSWKDEKIAWLLSGYANNIEINPLIQAITDNEFERFKQKYASIHIPHDVLLRYIIHLDRWDMFSHVLNSVNFCCNFLDFFGRTLLMNLAFVSSKEQYAKALIAKGAEVNCADKEGLTYLHLAASYLEIDHSKLVEIVLENGADIDAQDEWGHTPLYTACYYGNRDFVHLMMYHGADPNVPSLKGAVPITVAPDDLHDILFDYTFDEKVTVRLGTLTKAANCKNNLFERIIERTEDVSYEWEDWRFFAVNLRAAEPTRLKLLLEKIEGIILEANEESPLLVPIIESRAKNVIKAVLESTHAAELIQTSKPSFPAIALIASCFNEEEVTEVGCLMLSYGLQLTDDDLDCVFHYHGFCDLFSILLHMDIEKDEDNIPSIARLYYDLDYDIERFYIINRTLHFDILKYFNHSKLKQFFLESSDQEIANRVRKLPDVSSLVELSRNVARRYIIHNYKIQNSRQFYTILKLLPIGELNQKILGFERRVYCI